MQAIYLCQPDQDLQPVVALIHQAFGPDEARVAPPSSALRLTPSTLRGSLDHAELWLIGTAPLCACLLLRPQADALSLGKLAVAPQARGRGLASQLIRHAQLRARALQLSALTLTCRIELVENHAIYRHLGFVEVSRHAHPGFDRPTSLIFRKQLCENPLLQKPAHPAA